MILDVKLIKNSSIYCEESALATVANWLNRDYRMMFSGMLEFDYSRTYDFVGQKIGERIQSGISLPEMIDLLQHYHGIRAEMRKAGNNIKELVINQINHKMPVLTYLSAQVCNWNGDKTGNIYFLIIGYDNDFLYGYDLHNNSDALEKLPYDILQENYTNSKDVQVYEVVENERSVGFEEVKKIVQERYDLEKTEKKIVKMAEDLQKGYTGEFINDLCEEFRYIPISSRLIDIVRGRKLFAETCYYIAEISGDKFIQYIGDCYIDIGERWNIVWNMLAKAYLINNDERIERKISVIIDDVVNRIKNAAQMEKKLILNIFGECEIKERMVRTSNKIKEDSGYKFIDLNIADFFDNKAFQENKSEVKADMTGYGEFFQTGELPDNRIIIVGKTGFYINTTSYDNLICNNQIIAVKPNRYNKIYILGCAEWGDGSGKLQIGNDHYVDSLWMEFPDWYYCKMNMENGWSGKAIDYEGKVVERGLFCLDFELNENEVISWIKLPSVKNMHIFGIKFLSR